MHRVIVMVVLLAAFAIGGVASGEPTPTPATVTPPPSLHPAAQAMARERAWWNHDAIVTELALNGEQRAKMDELLQTSLHQERESRRKQQQASVEFEEALHKGDLQAARKAAPGLREALGESWDCKSTLMLDVLSVLNGEQRQKLLASHSDLLRQPWEDRPSSPLRGRRLLLQRPATSR